MDPDPSLPLPDLEFFDLIQHENINIVILSFDIKTFSFVTFFSAQNKNLIEFCVPLFCHRYRTVQCVHTVQQAINGESIFANFVDTTLVYTVQYVQS